MFIYTETPSSGDVGPLIVPMHEHELLSVWVHRRLPTVVDAMLVHSSRSYAAAWANPLCLFVDRFSIGGRSPARAPAGTSASSGDADSATQRSGCSAAPASDGAQVGPEAASSGASSKRGDNSVGASSKRGDHCRRLLQRWRHLRRRLLFG